MLNGHTLSFTQYDAANVDSGYGDGALNGSTKNVIDIDTLTWTTYRYSATLGATGTRTLTATTVLPWNPVLVNVYVQNELVRQVINLQTSFGLTSAEIATIKANIAYLESLNFTQPRYPYGGAPGGVEA